MPVVSRAEQRRKKHQRHDREQVFDDQPPDRDVARLRVQIVVVRKDAHENDGAGDGQRHSENQACRPVPAKRAREEHAQHSRHRTLDNGARNGDAPHGQQFFDVELEPDAEHEQNDADFGELFCQRRVGDEAGCVRPHQRARQQVTDNRRKPEAVGEEAQYQGRGEPSR